VLPGEAVLVFGSLTVPGRFHNASDVDLGLPEHLSDRNVYALQAALEDRLRRPVDVVELGRCRFRRSIESLGEWWTS
jgi:predicted nucleotidyltransferase